MPVYPLSCAACEQDVLRHWQRNTITQRACEDIASNRNILFSGACAWVGVCVPGWVCVMFVVYMVIHTIASITPSLAAHTIFVPIQRPTPIHSVTLKLAFGIFLKQTSRSSFVFENGMPSKWRLYHCDDIQFMRIVHIRSRQSVNIRHFFIIATCIFLSQLVVVLERDTCQLLRRQAPWQRKHIPFNSSLNVFNSKLRCVCVCVCFTFNF